MFTLLPDSLIVVLGSPLMQPAGSHLRIHLLDGERVADSPKWQLTTPILRKEVGQAGLFYADVATAPRAHENFGEFYPESAQCQVVCGGMAFAFGQIAGIHRIAVSSKASRKCSTPW